MKATLQLTFLLISFALFSQEKYEYYGVVMLNGSTDAVISYRLVFTEAAGKIKGYSVTDLTGPHETKNEISGTYDPKTKVFSFNEEDILYTKSTISDNMFCFINFSGKVKLVNDNSRLEGTFKGLFKNGQKCIDGNIALMGNNKLYKIMGKVNKKLQSSKKYDASVKKRANPIALLDSLKVNNLVKGQNLNVFMESATVQLELWDNGKEDGDQVNIYQDGKLLLRDYKVTNSKKIISVSLDRANIFTITAVNEGTIAPNTAQIRLVDGSRTFELVSNLKKDESASITILKKKK